ncbi:MAG TPA: monovalent cation/H+ antiporter complex subunit F [Acidimicrobiia bacterium]|nr:monovalent cation/H+ antiporter complex subunit F [Acidimicrobiia bacterium]
MNAWSWAAVALLAGALAPALMLGARGSSIDRLVGLELAGSVATITLLVMAQAASQSSYLVVPLVLVLLSFAGTLVFTRLLGPRSS